MPWEESNRGRPVWEAPKLTTEGETDARTDTAGRAAGGADTIPAVAGSHRRSGLTQAEVEQFGDDVLCGLYLLIQDEVKSTRDRLGLLDWEIRRRLADRAATVIGEGKYALVLRPGTIRTAYLSEWLEALKEPLGMETWNAVMRPHIELDPDKRALNDLRKRGGEIAAIIAQAIVETRSEGKLERAKQ